MLTVKNNLLPTLSRFFEDDWTTNFHKDESLARTSLPSINISETAEAFMLEMAAPGMKKEDFSVALKNNTLVIKAERTAENEENESPKYIRKEFSYHTFQRSFTLNHNMVESEQIKAKYEDGILYLNLPKKEEVKEKPAKRIEIL